MAENIGSNPGLRALTPRTKQPTIAKAKVQLQRAKEGLTALGLFDQVLDAINTARDTNPLSSPHHGDHRLSRLENALRKYSPQQGSLSELSEVHLYALSELLISPSVTTSRTHAQPDHKGGDRSSKESLDQLDRMRDALFSLDRACGGYGVN